MACGIRTLLHLLCLGFTTLSAPNVVQAEALATPITGTFLQLYDEHETWSQARWNTLFQAFQDIGLREIIVQWAKYGQAPKPSEDSDKQPARAISTVLSHAKARGMQVWVGLAHDPGYWGFVGKSPRLTAGYLQRRRAYSLAVAEELVPLLRPSPVFRGFYINQEIDDVNWISRAKRKELVAHLARLCRGLERLLPGVDIALSGFANARMSPGSFAGLWGEILAETSVDRVLFQDGVGVSKLKLRHVGAFAEALERTALEHGAKLTLIVEIFQQTQGSPINEGEFAAVPADMDRIRRQLRTAADYEGSGVLAFSVPEYMSPLGGPAATRLFEEYRALLNSAPPEAGGK
jgi:hypothetical protein